MLNFFSDVILRYRFKKKVKGLSKQSKKAIKTLRSMVIILPQDHSIDEKVFIELSKDLNISIKKITIIVFGKEEILKANFNLINTIFYSRKQLSILGNFSDEMNIFFKIKSDLLINYFTQKDPFPELISINCKSKLRIGFFKANLRINDIILKISPEKTDLFLNESKNYINAFLKNRK
jgi:hypothetical protein